MRSALIAGVLAAVVSSPAHAGPVTVWLQDAAPDAKTVEKSDLQTGGTLHLWQVDLRFPPMPQTASDVKRVEQLPVAVENGKGRWDEFEIELAIAKDLQMVIDDVTLLRNDRDRSDLVDALVFQGAAIARAFDPATFATDPKAAPFRSGSAESAAPRAWVDAYALSGKLADRSKLPDGTAWQDYQRWAPAIEKLAKGKVTVDEGIGEVWIDGAKVAGGTVDLRAGRHWIHVVRGGVVHGRSVLDVAPGQTYALPRAVSDASLDATREKVAGGKAVGLPEDVGSVLARIAAYNDGGAIFLGVDDGKRFTVVSYDGKAALKDTRLVTVQLYGEIGGGVLVSPIFEENENPDEAFVAGAAHAGIGFEVGISYFVFGGGVDAAFTPGNTIQFASDSGDANSAVSMFPQPHFEIGAYALRPTKPAPTLAILGGIAWLAPAHLGYGGRLTVGIPFKNETTWVRLTAGAYYGPTTLWAPDEGQSMIDAFFRVGFGARP